MLGAEKVSEATLCSDLSSRFKLPTVTAGTSRGQRARQPTCTNGHIEMLIRVYTVRVPALPPVSLSSLILKSMWHLLYISPLTRLCCVFKQRRAEREKRVEVMSLWQMVLHWDIGRTIYGKGKMLPLNLRRCNMLHFSVISLPFPVPLRSSAVLIFLLSIYFLPFSLSCIGCTHRFSLIPLFYFSLMYLMPILHPYYSPMQLQKHYTAEFPQCM